MEKNSRSIYMALSTSVLTFAGLLLLIMSFYGQFYLKYDYSTAAMIFFSVVSAIVFSVLFNTIRRKWAVWAVFALLSGIFFIIYREALIGGTGTAINEVINETSGYFDAEMWYLDIPRRYARESNEVMALYIVLLLMAAVYAFCISTPKLAALPWTVSFLFFVYPLALEKYPGGFWVLFGIAYLLVMAVTAMHSARRKSTVRSILPVQIFSIAVGAVICLAGTAAIRMKPEKEFERSAYFASVYDRGRELYEKYQNGELAINKLEDFLIALNPFIKEGNAQGGNGKDPAPGPSASGAASKIGAGELGQVDELIFSGKDVLQVVMPDVDEKVYLKGFIGARYTGSRWLEPEDIAWPKDKDVHSQTLTSDYLGQLWLDMPIKAYSTTMKIRYVAENQDYTFVPLYPSGNVMDRLDAYRGDAGFDKFNEETGIEYIDFNQNQLRNIDGADPYANGRLKKFAEAEALYRQYAYETYLDVNTTAADGLYEMWGNSRIGGAADRYEVACRIRKYLGDRCKYTTKPGKLPEGRDFVDYFLNETQEGYCTYFATSAVMMFRSAGIPARYVEGYAFRTAGSTYLFETAAYTDYDGEGNITPHTKECRVKLVPDSAAHAWVEYYVDGVGWVDFEVTPGNYTAEQEPATTQPPTTAKQPSTTENRTTAVGEKPTQTVSHSTADPEEKTGFRFRIRLSKTAERILICAAVFAAVLFGFAMILKIRHKKAEAVYEKIRDMGGDEPAGWCVMTMYGDYMRMLKHFGYIRKEYETEVDFAKRTARSCGFVAEAEAVRMAELFENATFGSVPVTGAQSAEHWKIHMAVRERMYGGIGKIKQLIFKYIYNL